MRNMAAKMKPTVSMKAARTRKRESDTRGLKASPFRRPMAAVAVVATDIGDEEG